MQAKEPDHASGTETICYVRGLHGFNQPRSQTVYLYLYYGGGGGGGGGGAYYTVPTQTIQLSNEVVNKVLYILLPCRFLCFFYYGWLTSNFLTLTT